MKSFDTGSKPVNIAVNIGAASTEVWVSIRAAAMLDVETGTDVDVGSMT